MNYHQIGKLMVIVTVVLTVLWASLAGLAELAQAAAMPDPALTAPAGAPSNLPLLASGPLTVTKSSVNEGDTPLRPGERITYTITIFNNGDQATTNVTIFDTLPANTTFVPGSIDVLPPSPDWSVGTGSILVQGITVTDQALVTVTYAVTVNPVVANGTEIINTASVTSTELADPTSATVTDIVVAEADLSLSKSGSPNPVLVGDSLTYSLTITNAGPSVAANVVVTDTLPSTVSFGAAPGCNESGGVVTCAVGTLNSGASETVTLVVTPTLAGILTNLATVSSAANDPDNNNNDASTTTTVNPKADLVISKIDEPEPVIAGETITYTLTVTNNGPSPAADVVISDTLPLSLSLQSVSPATSTQNGQQLTWNLSNMSVGETQTFTIVANVGGDVRNSIQNTAVVSSSTFDPAAGNNSDTETTSVNTSANLTVTKSDSPDPIGTGNPLIYIVQINNNGPSDALLVTLTDNLPATVSAPLVIPSQGSCSLPPVITCNMGKIASGSGANVTLLVTPNSPGIITNTVSVASSEFDPDTSNNTDAEATTVNPANLSVTKTDSPDPVQVGQPLTYTLTVASAPGLFKADNVTLVDILPANVALKSVSINPPEQGSCSGTSTITCDLNEMFSGTNATVSIVVTPTVAGLVTNTATVTSDMPDPNPANNTATSTTTVNPVADLMIAKSDFPDPVTAGTSLTYTLTITNNGPSEATDVVITDTLPASVTFDSSSGFCSSQPNNQVRCTYANIASGSAGAPATITVTVNPAAPNLITNTASVTSNEFDPNANNNAATITTTVNRLVNLSITKTGSANPIAAGNSLTYTLTVANSGPSQASGVIITDTLPAGVTFAAASSGCSNVSNQVICSNLSVASGGAITASIRVIVAPSTLGTLANVATVTSTEPDPNTANNTVTATTTVTRVTDLSISQSTPNPVTAGDNITFNLTVINNGPSDAGNVTVINTLPAEVAFQSVSHAGCNHSGGIVTCSLGGMVSGSTVPIAIVANANSSSAGNIINTAAVTVSGSNDPVPENNSTAAPAFVGELAKVFLPLLLKPTPTDLFIENDTGGGVNFSVVGTGVSCSVPAGNQNFFCGSFPPGTYTVQVNSICGNLSTSKYYESGPQSTRVFCN
ncbi:MAG: DUF11 domain-containing protein [Anaerolineales bacterium]|nr:DUF11 domain-containing protein [Anaerolineales bacterium]